MHTEEDLTADLRVGSGKGCRKRDKRVSALLLKASLKMPQSSAKNPAPQPRSACGTDVLPVGQMSQRWTLASSSIAVVAQTFSCFCVQPLDGSGHPSFRGNAGQSASRKTGSSCTHTKPFLIIPAVIPHWKGGRGRRQRVAGLFWQDSHRAV